MALLNFKHGLLANFKENSPAFSEGTIYVTRDERAMYVDLPAYMDNDAVVHEAKRIRIGDMRTYTYIEDLQNDLKNDMTTLTTSALFYAEKKKGMVDGAHDTSKDVVINALLKWNGSQFISLNDTSALANAIATLETVVAGHTTKLSEIDVTLGEHTTDIEELQEIVNGLVGGDTGSIADQIDAKIASHAEAQALIDAAQDEIIGGHTTTISQHAGTIAELTTNLGNLSTNLTDNYYTKTDIENKGYAVDVTVAATYATKDELNGHIAIAATKEELNTVSGVANEAKAATVTNAGSITTLSGEFSGYKTSNDAALAAVKATAEAAVTQADYDAKIAALEAEDSRIAGLVATEKERAEGIEANHETRLAEIELFFDTAADPESAIDNLNEILQYIEDHKGEAIDMAGDIQENANAISGLDTRLTTAEGKVSDLETNLAAEITNRTAAVETAVTSAQTYTDTKLTWGQF